jgi:hypothetical protein
MFDCRYKDEEIKKKIDEKLSKQKQTEWKLVSRDNRENNYSKKYPNPKQGQNVNNVYLKSSGEYVNNHYNNVLGGKNVYKGSNFVSNEETEGGFKTTNNKKFNNNKESNFSNINNFTNKKFNTINANTFTSYSNAILKNPLKISTNTNITSTPVENQEIDIDHYFNAALNVNKEIESCISKEKICNSEKNISIKSKITPITQEDIKEFVEEIQKNKETVSRVESFSCPTEASTPKNLTSTLTQSNTCNSSQVALSPSQSLNDISKIELSLNVTHDETKQETILNDLEDKKETSASASVSGSKKEDECDYEFKLDYDLSKIPTNFLNANSYSNYFYQTGNNNPRKDKEGSQGGNTYQSNFNKSASANMEENFMQVRKKFTYNYLNLFIFSRVDV